MLIVVVVGLVVVMVAMVRGAVDGQALIPLVASAVVIPSPLRLATLLSDHRLWMQSLIMTLSLLLLLSWHLMEVVLPGAVVIVLVIPALMKSSNYHLTPQNAAGKPCSEYACPIHSSIHPSTHMTRENGIMVSCESNPK